MTNIADFSANSIEMMQVGNYGSKIEEDVSLERVERANQNAITIKIGNSWRHAIQVGNEFTSPIEQGYAQVRRISSHLITKPQPIESHLSLENVCTLVRSAVEINSKLSRKLPEKGVSIESFSNLFDRLIKSQTMPGFRLSYKQRPFRFLSYAFSSCLNLIVKKIQKSISLGLTLDEDKIKRIPFLYMNNRIDMAIKFDAIYDLKDFNEIGWDQLIYDENENVLNDRTGSIKQLLNLVFVLPEYQAEMDQFISAVQDYPDLF